MTIRYLLIPEIGDIKEFTLLGYTAKTSFQWLRAHIQPHFDELFEHVAVLYEGQRRDMFVGETSAINGRHIRNIRATNIYRANAIRRYEEGDGFDLPRDPERPRWTSFDPESLPAISGPVVLFPNRRVWF